MPHYDDDIPLRCSCGCTTDSHARDLRGGRPGPCSTHFWCKNFDPNGPKKQSEYERGYEQAKTESTLAVQAAYAECARIVRFNDDLETALCIEAAAARSKNGGV